MQDVDLISVDTLKDDTKLYLQAKKAVSNRKAKNVTTNTRLIMLEDMYNILIMLYDNSELSENPINARQWVTKELVGFILPLLEYYIHHEWTVAEDMQYAYEIWEKSLALASRESFHHFNLFMELDDKQKPYTIRAEVLQGMTYYMNMMENNEKLMNLIGSFSPSFGKCVHENTPIWTPKGHIPIKDIEVGDIVYSMDDREVVEQVVEGVAKTRKKQVVFTTGSGKKITTSPDHRMFTDKGYKMAKDITTEDYFYRLNGIHEPTELEKERYKDFVYEKIIDIEYIDEEVNMVDIQVSNTRNFFANGYVSHNSLITNRFSAWVLGRDTDGSILRLSYSDDLLNGFSRSIKNLMLEGRYRQVFPHLDRFGNRLWQKEKDSDWTLKGTKNMVSHYTRTRDGSVTGVRAKSYIIFDDMIKGAEESDNDRIHDGYWDKYTTEWRNRKENDKVKEITIGTMWNPKDMLGRKAEQLESRYTARKGKYPYSKEYLDDEGDIVGVVIRFPLLDENDKSTCEAIYSTEDALAIREDTDEFLFSCVYQQDPISPTGRLFSQEELMFYNFYGTDIRRYDKIINLDTNAYAALDPVRKGTDNVAMPIFKQDLDDLNKYYLVDTIFKGISMEEVHEDIVDKIIQHSVVRLVLENNTDTSLKTLLDRMLHDRGYFACEIIEKYQTANKEKRIRDNNKPIRQHLVFPEIGLFPLNSEIGRFMTNVTRYSVDSPNRHDDAPDSLAMFTQEIVRGGANPAKVTAIKRPF